MKTSGLHKVAEFRQYAERCLLYPVCALARPRTRCDDLQIADKPIVRHTKSSLPGVWSNRGPRLIKILHSLKLSISEMTLGKRQNEEKTHAASHDQIAILSCDSKRSGKKSPNLHTTERFQWPSGMSVPAQIGANSWAETPFVMRGKSCKRPYCFSIKRFISMNSGFFSGKY
jgi:hypothetical protein